MWVCFGEMFKYVTFVSVCRSLNYSRINSDSIHILRSGFYSRTLRSLLVSINSLSIWNRYYWSLLLCLAVVCRYCNVLSTLCHQQHFLVQFHRLSVLRILWGYSDACARCCFAGVCGRQGGSSECAVASWAIQESSTAMQDDLAVSRRLRY